MLDETAMMTATTAELKAEIEREAKVRGLNFYTYQANRARYDTTWTYAIHSSPDRPAYSRDCDGPKWAVDCTREGLTCKSQTARALRNLLRAVLAMPVNA